MPLRAPQLGRECPGFWVSHAGSGCGKSNYVTRHLWPKHGRGMRIIAKQFPNGVSVDRVAAQVRKLADAIKPAVLDDITGVSPRQGLTPDLVGGP